ncbi:dynein axonemal light chain 4 [Onthophagus taurus]|uniref:dynein axonemal light chain 4 n=1 Tax=Onthophagus taurus TaxID=166361 RepID=UPI000C20F024|nr:dynein light chain 4, axonemal [Onthophagus taurus]
MGDEAKEGEVKKVVHTYPLVRYCDMSEEAKQEIVELVVTACEKFADNNEAAAKMVKEQMDKKLGPPFNVVIGEGFGFEISYEAKNLLYMFFGGNLAVVIWKC